MRFRTSDQLVRGDDAGIAQVVERRPEKPRVPSASLGPGAILNTVVDQAIFTHG